MKSSLPALQVFKYLFGLQLLIYLANCVITKSLICCIKNFFWDLVQRCFPEVSEHFHLCVCTSQEYTVKHDDKGYNIDGNKNNIIN